MRIAVVGATGTIGRACAGLLERRGHELRRLSRSAPVHRVDLTTGAGLTQALRDVEVVVNASNGPPSRRAHAVLVDGTRRLLEASDAHHVCVSIVGIEQVPGAYYRVKLAQEAAVRAGGRPFTIVRATQVHPFLEAPLRAAARARIALRSGARFQPVDVGELAAALADVAEAPARGATVTVAGPQVLTLSELRVGRGVPLPLPLPPRLGRALRAGSLTIAEPDVRGETTFAQWLAHRA